MPTAIIEVYERHGLRTIRLPKNSTMEHALYMAHDIWEEDRMELKVRVLRELPGGMLTCVCQFPPMTEETLILPMGEAA